MTQHGRGRVGTGGHACSIRGYATADPTFSFVDCCIPRTFLVLRPRRRAGSISVFENIAISVRYRYYPPTTTSAALVQEALVIVDKMYFEVPDLMKDAYWDLKRIYLPVTEATAAFKKVHFAGSTSYYQ